MTAREDTGDLDNNDAFGALMDPCRKVREWSNPACRSRHGKVKSGKVPPYTHYTVRAATLGMLLSETNATDINLLKMDCEHCEYAALEYLRAEPSVASRVRRLAGELHNCAPHRVASCRELVMFARATWPTSRLKHAPVY
jgi:hypothetical protein